MSENIFIYGDNIDTDRIIPGKYTKTTNNQELAAHVFEDLDPSFRHRVQPGAIVVAGCNFGCGSSREQAAIAIKEAGVALLIAKSFARIFFRNAINIGLPLMEIPEHTLDAQSIIEFNLELGILRDHRQDRQYQVKALPPFLNDIIAAGGLVPYLRIKRDYV
jgi:3-isopropylmalate dehydratase small subunit